VSLNAHISGLKFNFELTLGLYHEIKSYSPF